MQRLWVTGYRSYELNVFNLTDPKVMVITYALKNYYQQLQQENGLDWIISGGNLGIEQWALSAAIELHPQLPHLKAAMMTPYMQFEQHWNEKNQIQYEALKKQVDFFASTSQNTYQNPQQLRNYQRFMLHHTDRAVLVYDLEHPGEPKYDYEVICHYQKQHQYPLDLIDFYSLEDAAEDYQELKQSDDFSQ